MKKLVYRLPSSRSFTRLFSILGFAAFTSWLAPEPVAAYTRCVHRTGSTTGPIVGYHCPPCSGTTFHGTTRGVDTPQIISVPGICGGSSINASLRMSHTGIEYRCTPTVEGRGAVAEDPTGTLIWDFGIADPADLVTCTEFIAGVKGESGLFRIQGSATAITSTCNPVTGEAPIQSRLTFTGFCNNDQTTTVSQTITLDEAATNAQFPLQGRPDWCPPTGLCELRTVGPPDDGLPTTGGGTTTEKLCADAFPQEPAGTPGRLASKQMVLYSIGFSSNDCSGTGETHAAGETFRARGCQTQSWDPLTAESSQECVVTQGGTSHTHLASDTGSGLSECGPGSGVVQGSFETQGCKTSGLVKYRCFSRPDTEDVPGFNVSAVNLAAGAATLNGVANKKPGSFNRSQGMVEFDFPQCSVAANTTIDVTGEAEFFFKAATKQKGFAIDSSTAAAH